MNDKNSQNETVRSLNVPTRQTPESLQDPDSIDLYAHRGSTLLAPENTVAAFELALSYSADVLEIDVRLTRDSELLVIHDERLDRTCNASGRIGDYTLHQLEAFNAGYHFTDLSGNSWRERGVRLIGLKNLLEQFPDTRINIDLKDRHLIAAERLAQVIEQTASHERVNVGSFHSPVLEHFRQCMPGVSTAATQSEVAQLYFLRHRTPTPVYRYLQIPMRYMGIPLATASFIRHAQQRNIGAVYWTVNDVKAMEALVDKNVNGIVTDRIDLAASLLGRGPASLVQ